MTGFLLLPVFLPALTGIFLLISSFLEHVKISRQSGTQEPVRNERAGKGLPVFVGMILVISAAAALWAAWAGDGSVTLFYMMDNIPISFRVDEMGKLFVTILSIVWVLVGVYAFVYMEHEGGEKRFFGLYLLVYGILVALDFAENLVTLYFFYEMMTLASMPLVLHNGSREAIMAALKYLF